MRRWSESGVSVRVLTQDASTLAGAKALLKEAAQEGPIGGIFHLAVVSSVMFINLYLFHIESSLTTFKSVNIFDFEKLFFLD